MTKKAFPFRMAAAAASALAALLVAGAAPAAILNLNSITPSNGSAVASSDFTPNPLEVVVTGGGDIDLSTVTEDGAGFVSADPNYGFILTSDTDDLSFYLAPASADTVILVVGPDGSMYFNGDFLPHVDIFPAYAGEYDVWVGSLSGETPSATLGISHP